MTGAGNGSADIETAEELREALAKARADKAKLKDTLRRLNARVAALTEEKEELRKERDAYGTELEALRAELHAVTEEMAAAARFSDNEWRAHCDGVEAKCGRLRAVVRGVAGAALAYLQRAEAAARQATCDAEAAERKRLHLAEESAAQLLPARDVYRRAAAAAQHTEALAAASAEETVAGAKAQLRWLCRALDCSPRGLYCRFLRKECKEGPGPWYDTSAPARGLWELYLALCDVGFPTDAAMVKLLEGEQAAALLYFNAVGHAPEYGDYNYAIPPAAAYDFFHRLLRHLPRLQTLRFSHFPALSSPGALEALAGAPPTLQWLALLHTDYTVADLRALHERCPRLATLCVHPSRCTDWGQYAVLTDQVQRMRLVHEECGGTIRWEGEEEQ